LHEWALAEAIIKTIDNVAKEKGEKIFRVIVKVGELQQIENDILEFALNELKKEYTLNDVEIVLEEEPAVLRCRVCGYEWKFRDNLANLDPLIAESIHFIPESVHAFIKCPSCGSPDFEIVKGRGVWIEEIEFEGE